ncbi:MAG: hypothetical protein HXX11_15960 [Desulfuromonadales bacterium]|nr:hypothetical protein [Desulfuromonadales bacterium]
MKTIDLSQVISEFQSILRHSIRESIEYRSCLPDERCASATRWAEIRPKCNRGES